MRNKVIGALVSATVGVTTLVGAAAPASAAPLSGQATPLSGQVALLSSQVVGGFTTLASCNAGRAEWRNRGYIVGSCTYAGGEYHFIARR
ncbi:hypothetical protein [Oerskovia gallyi]|uniref:DUF3761 domain-containing protein n=1 Tax=Oerskovia gallyi TaxID=2762226 RepID=A0ABR8V067_9CELL|nr:hypothetical protein [Oerskovia gallyi]MBD7998183.1 hypothetical protein [Oerskovia gallyi]